MDNDSRSGGLLPMTLILVLTLPLLTNAHNVVCHVDRCSTSGGRRSALSFSSSSPFVDAIAVVVKFFASDDRPEGGRVELVWDDSIHSLPWSSPDELTENDRHRGRRQWRFVLEGDRWKRLLDAINNGSVASLELVAPLCSSPLLISNISITIAFKLKPGYTTADPGDKELLPPHPWICLGEGTRGTSEQLWIRDNPAPLQSGLAKSGDATSPTPQNDSFKFQKVHMFVLGFVVGLIAMAIVGIVMYCHLLRRRRRIDCTIMADDDGVHQ